MRGAEFRRARRSRQAIQAIPAIPPFTSAMLSRSIITNCLVVLHASELRLRRFDNHAQKVGNDGLRWFIDLFAVITVPFLCFRRVHRPAGERGGDGAFTRLGEIGFLATASVVVFLDRILEHSGDYDIDECCVCRSKL